jgi:hypothetical protein
MRYFVVQPIGRALHTPHHDLLLNPHDFERFAGQDHKRMVQTRLVDADLAVADPFEDQRDFLDDRMNEV